MVHIRIPRISKIKIVRISKIKMPKIRIQSYKRR